LTLSHIIIISIILVIIFTIRIHIRVNQSHHHYINPRRDCQVSETYTMMKEVINDVANGLERRDEDGGKLEILRLVVGGNMATASLDTAPVGEVDMGDELCRG
jgi:hypothetical protein